MVFFFFLVNFGKHLLLFERWNNNHNCIFEINHWNILKTFFVFSFQQVFNPVKRRCWPHHCVIQRIYVFCSSTCVSSFAFDKIFWFKKITASSFSCFWFRSQNIVDRMIWRYIFLFHFGILRWTNGRQMAWHRPMARWMWSQGICVTDSFG